MSIMHSSIDLVSVIFVSMGALARISPVVRRAPAEQDIKPDARRTWLVDRVHRSHRAQSP
jgi:hypothetical protein